MAGKLCVLHGDDDYSAREALEDVKKGLEPRDALVPNTSVFDGRQVRFGQLETACNTVPFLADYRLVVVEGLMEQFQRGEGRPPAERASSRLEKLKEEWSGFKGMVRGTPDTTVLVLLSRAVRADNWILRELEGLGQFRRFDSLKGPDLERWMAARMQAHGGQATAGALRMLAAFVGGDLRRMDNEIQKLAVYAGHNQIQDRDVQVLVSDAREAVVFSMVDAMIEGRPGAALGTLRRLMEQGAAGPYVLTMLARQVRLMIQARSLEAEGAARGQMARAMGSGDFVVRKSLEQAGAFSDQALREIYRRLLETDVAIKTGGVADDLGLETLVAELSVRR